MSREAHVVGGGIGGLAVAGSLAARGWRVVVHERAKELREVGAGIYLKENALRPLDALGVTSELVGKGTRLTGSEIHDRRGRRLLKRTVDNERVYTVKRIDLHEALADAARKHGAQIELNSNIEFVGPDGTIEIAGKRVRTDLIVGADGIGSTVRDRLGLTRKAVQLPNGSTRILVPRLESDRADRSIEYWRKDKRVMVVPCGGSTYLCASSRESDARAVALPFDVDYWTSCFPELGELFARVDPLDAIHHAHGYARVHGWSSGVGAIIGDAVHGQPPNLGQGAGLAIANGYALAEQLDRASIPDALRLWEKVERPLTEAVQNWSYRWDGVVHGWPTFGEPARSAVVWTIGHFPLTRANWGRLYRGEHAATHV